MPQTSRWPGRVARLALAFLALGFSTVLPHAAQAAGESGFKTIQPILREFCFDCHADGANKGGVSFDEFKSEAELLENDELWLKALKNVRSGIMPPPKKAQPSAEQKQQLEAWIKTAVFRTDPANPDPGRVTVRRLNRIEYQNTIRDLLGVEFDATKEFPADDSGHGFDNIGDVLTLSPMLLEKYLAAAKTIVTRAEAQRWAGVNDVEKFLSGDAPGDAAGRREHARKILQPFVERAYRHPVDARTMDRLVALAEDTYSQKGKTFESGISQAMIAVLASPRFLFREESAEDTKSPPHPFVDEYALASRLSYFLWSSMPDDELLGLARTKKLRANLDAQKKRMLADRKSEAFIRNFVGQWFQTRDIETVAIDARQVLNRENPEPTPMTAAPVDPERERRMARFRELRMKEETNDLAMTAAEKKELQEVHDGLFGPASQRPTPTLTNRIAEAAQTNRFGQRGQTNRFGRGNRGPRTELTADLRRAMRLETEKAFDYVLREDRSLLDLLDSDYTFLNERLARHYGLTNLNVSGDEMVLAKLPADSPRGGVMTHGSVLTVTSNPTRTSPVKRGLFVLDNLLGTPPPPPPPDIPPLEDAAKAMKDKRLSLRETLALHRGATLCSSCHNRMDPLGLALDNFNAMGMWREQERGQRIDATGQLLSGESFTNVNELKKILARNHATEFYRTITEKLLTYALGRGLEYYDVATVDAIVERLQKSNGRPSELLAGVIQSAPFQKTRAFDAAENVKPSTQRADVRTNP